MEVLYYQRDLSEVSVNTSLDIKKLIISEEYFSDSQQLEQFPYNPHYYLNEIDDILIYIEGFGVSSDVHGKELPEILYYKIEK